MVLLIKFIDEYADLLNNLILYLLNYNKGNLSEKHIRSKVDARKNSLASKKEQVRHPKVGHLSFF